MRYLTPRKRAERSGASGTGTLDHWYMTVSAVGLAFMTPVVVIILGMNLGRPRAEVLATFATPWIAILTALFLFVAMNHFWRGAKNMLFDYVHGNLMRLTLIAVIALSYVILAVGLFALARIAV